jgi:hypothetical protein
MENLAIRVNANYGGSKATRVLVPKIHINGKITLEWKKNKKPMLNGPYVVINQLKVQPFY